MRAYPHKIDQEILDEHRQSSREMIESSLPGIEEARAQRGAALIQGFGEEMRDWAKLCYAYEEPLAEIAAKLRQASAHFASALEFDITLDPWEYLQYLTLAVVVRDTSFASRLVNEGRQRYTNPNVDGDELIYLTAEIAADLAAGRATQLQPRISAALTQLQSKRIDRLERLYTEGLVRMAAAMAARDQTAFDQALAAHAKDFQKRVDRPGERSRPRSLLDIEGLAFIRFALDRGLQCRLTSPYLPVDLLGA